MKIQLSTEQLLQLTENGQVTLPVSKEEVIIVVADKLDISLDQLASGTEAKVNEQLTIVY